MYLNKWLSFTYNHEIIRYRFLKFLYEIRDANGDFHYLKILRNILITSDKYFTVSFFHIVSQDPVLAIWITDEPDKMLNIFRSVIKSLFESIFHIFRVKKFKISIGIADFPIYDVLINFNKNNNSLIKIKGTVVSVTDTYSKINLFKIICLKCLELQKLFFKISNQKIVTISCFLCKSPGPFQVSRKYFLCSAFQKIKIKETIFKKNHQKWVDYKQIILKNEFIGETNLGKEIELTGILRYKTKFNLANGKKTPSFLIFFDANFIENRYDSENFFDLWEKKFIIKIYKKKKIFNFIINSFFDTLLINKNVKIAILLSLFGGENSPSENRYQSTTKENVHVLIIGKQSTSKTYILRSIQNSLPKSLYTPSQKIKMKYLTVCLKFDELLEDWTIEGGMLVVSDKGYFIINQIDQMSNVLQKIFSEAIDRKKIYIMKKNKINYFNTRCSLVATADSRKNPNDSILLKNNIWKKKLAPLFDLTCMIVDKINSTKDNLIANFFLKKCENYKKFFFTLKYIKKKKINKFFAIKNTIRKNLVRCFTRKYVDYTRYFISPKIKQRDQRLILDFYKSIKICTIDIDGINLTSRNLELLILLIKSSSRIHLRDTVNKDDVRTGIYVILKFFTQFQSLRIQHKIGFKFNLFSKKEKFSLSAITDLLDIIMKKQKKNYFKKRAFEKFCNSFCIKNYFLKKFYFSKNFIESGYKLDIDRVYILTKVKM